MKKVVFASLMAVAVLGVMPVKGYGASVTKNAYTIFTNGIIYINTINSNFTATNLVACGGVVVAYNANPADYPGASFVDLNGGVAYPGFNDSHCHLIEMGSLPPTFVNVAGCRNAAEIAARVAWHARFIPDGEPVIGYGFSLPTLSNTWMLSDLALIDSAAGNHELYLGDNLGHNCIVNSMLMSNYNITATSTVAPAGIIDQEDGKATGLLRESAMRLAGDIFDDEIPDAGVFANTLSLVNYWVSFGYTSINDMMAGTGNRVMRPQIFRDMENQGILPLRVNYAYTIYGLADVESATNYVGHDTDLVRFLGVKLFVDGAFGAGQAWTTWTHLQGNSNGLNYVYTNDTYGTNYNLNRIVDKVDDLHLNIHYHSQGDAAIDAILNALDAVIAQKGRLSSVHTIIHVALPRDDQILKMKGYGSNLVVTVQPAFWKEEANAGYYYGNQMTNTYPIMNLINSGLMVGMSTDYAVSLLSDSPPLAVMSIGMSPDKWDPSTRTAMTMNALINGLTVGSAATTATNDTGTLEIGKKADFVVYNRNLYSVTPQELTNGTVKVLSTWVGGSLKYNSLTPKSVCGDVDGDRLADLISVVGSDWYVWFSSSGYTQRIGPVNLGVSGTPVTGDIDGDGLADLISVMGSYWYVWFSTSHYSVCCGPYNIGISGSTPITGDVDGDGLADLISVVGSYWYVWFSTSHYSTLCGPYDMVISGTPVTGDIDGDGLADLISVAGSDWYVWFSTSQYSTLFGPYDIGVLDSVPVTGDIDGDGLADLISVVGSDWYVRFSTSQYQVRGGPYTMTVP